MQNKYTLDTVHLLDDLATKEESVQYYLDKKNFSCPDLIVESSSYPDIDSTLLKNLLHTDNDFDAGKLLYEALSDLTLRDASDRGFWTYLAHNELYPYVHKRWPSIENPPKGSAGSYIKNHWVLDKNAQGDLIRHTLSGLWWSFHLSVDKDREDKYELTRIFMENQNLRTRAFGPVKAARHKECFVGVMEFILENNLNRSNFEENVISIVPYINSLGGTKPLSFFEREWFKEKLEKRFRKDLSTYGRLFRRNEKPSASQSKLNLTSQKEANKTEEKDKNPIAWFNLAKQGAYQINKSKNIDADYHIPIYKEDENAFLLQCYSNGRVNKLEIDWLLSKKRNKDYKNGLCLEQDLTLLVIAKDTDLIALKYLKDAQTVVKLHQVENISNRRQAHLLGYQVLYDTPDNLDYEVVNEEYKLSRITFKSFTASGKPLSNSYYKNEWVLLAQAIPSWFKSTLSL